MISLKTVICINKDILLVTDVILITLTVILERTKRFSVE